MTTDAARQMLPRFGLLLWLLWSPAAHADQFIRVDETATAAQLQTAVVRYQKGPAIVDLIGAIHIADAGYYQALNQRFKAYDRVLFEMIGGEGIADMPAVEANADEPGPPGSPLEVLTRLYDVSADFLQLVGQTDAIDYRAKNFVHADLTVAEFQQLQAQRKESLMKFLIMAGKQAPEPEVQPNLFKLIAGIVRKDPDAVKLELVHTLGEGDDQLAKLGQETVILTERNKRCLEVMTRELAAGRKKLGVFYGAAHFPDMAQRLDALGFKRTQCDWVTAWQVAKPR